MSDHSFVDKAILINVEDARHITALGRTKLYELINERAIASVKVGTRRLIVLASVHAWIASLGREVVR